MCKDLILFVQTAEGKDSSKVPSFSSGKKCEP